MPPSDNAWGVRSFRRFLFARGVSWAGNAVTLVALPVLVFQLTGSAALTGLLAALEAIPYLAFGLFVGALADRWNRKWTMVLAGAFSGVAMMTIPITSALQLLSVPHVFVVALTVSTLFVFFDAASFGAVPEIVGRERIASATGAMVAVSTIFSVAGPALGGLLISTIGAAWTLGLDASAFLLAALLTAVLPWRSIPRTQVEPLTWRSLRHDIAEGVRFIWSVHIIRWLTLIGAGASISAGAVAGLTIVVAVRQLGIPTEDPRIGLLYAATALGAFAVSLVVSRIQKSIPTGWITITALTVLWIAQICWALTTSIPLGLAVLIVLQAAATLTIMNGIIVRQSLAPDHLQARVNTTARMIAWGGTPLGALAGGLLAESLPVGTALLICSIGTLSALVLALAVRLWTVPTLAALRAEATHT